MIVLLEYVNVILRTLFTQAQWYDMLKSYSSIQLILHVCIQLQDI